MRLLLLLIILLTVEAKRKKTKSSKSSLPQAPPAPQMAENYPEKYPFPVDFLNVKKMGVYDPSSGLKEPFDIVPRHMRLPKSPEEELEWVRNADPTRLFKIPKGEDRRASEPKEEKPLSIREYNPYLEEVDTSNVTNGRIDSKMPELFDLENIQNLNFASPVIYRLNIAKGEAKFKRKRPPGYDRQIDERRRANINVSEAFSGGSFRLKEDRIDHDLKNWTTCDEFSKDARFHPREVAGVEWVAFYAWSPNPYPRFYDYFFSYPTAKIVEEYKSNYRRHLGDAVDWSQPMLLLKAWDEILLIAGDRRGLFHGIPKTEIPEQVKESSFLLPTITMRLKLLDPYLAIMLCEEKIALMLAIAGEEPAIEKVEAEAAKLGFRGIGEILVRDKEDMEEVQIKKALAEEVEEERGQEEDIGPRRPSPFFRDDPMFP